MVERRMFRVLERTAIVVAALALSIGLIALFSGGLLGGRDDPGVSSAAGGLGQSFRDLGHAHLSPGQPRPRYDSDPPTSGAHVPVAIERQGARLSNDAILQALEVGDVVVLYGTPKPPPGLDGLVRSVAGGFSPALAAAGQAVVLGRRPGVGGVTALAWTRLLRVGSAGDPVLRGFLQAYLGQGAPR
jgi:hypothetical protein